MGGEAMTFRIETPEDRYAREFGKSVTLTQVTIKPTPEPQPKDAEEAAEWARGSEYLDSLLDDAWEHLREECDEALKVNPNDEHAQKRLLQVQQHMRQRTTKDSAGLGLVVAKKVKARLSDKK